MLNEAIIVSNVKCGGCVVTIPDALQALPGITAVSVDIGTGTVTITGAAPVREKIVNNLAELGYPEV